MPNAYVYSAREYCNMLMCLGETGGNANHALRIYKERYPEARHPADSRLISAAFQRVLENRPIVPMATGGRGMDEKLEEKILSVVRENPHLGIRSAARAVQKANGTNISHWTVHNVMRRHNIRKQKVIKEKKTTLSDIIADSQERRKEYCSWLLDQQDNKAGFIEHVIWTDKATFTKNGMLDGRKSHIWSKKAEPLHINGEPQWSVNVWAGIYNTRILGPVFLPEKVGGEEYLDFINQHLVEIVDNLPLDVSRKTWFQHDGAPPHAHRTVRERLTELFKDRWIGRLGPHAWPPRSPDLNPLNFSLWVYVKERVFDGECPNADEMKRRITEAFEKLRQDCEVDPTFMPRLHVETEQRAKLCLQVDGGQFNPTTH